MSSRGTRLCCAGDVCGGDLGEVSAMETSTVLRMTNLVDANVDCQQAFSICVLDFKCFGQILHMSPLAFVDG